MTSAVMLPVMSGEKAVRSASVLHEHHRQLLYRAGEREEEGEERERDAQGAEAPAEHGRERVARVEHPQERAVRRLLRSQGALGRVVALVELQVAQVLARGGEEVPASRVRALGVAPCEAD